MPREPKAGVGHNSKPLTDEEKAALQHFHTVQIIEAQRVAAAKKAEYDAASGVVNKAFAALKGDLGYKRKDFEENIALLKMTETEFRNHENDRSRRLSLSGLPMGTQLDMFAGDTVDDALEAEANGYRAGRRADDPKPPEHIAPMFHTDWMRGWTRGQDENAAQFLVAQGVIDARAKAADPKGGLTGEDEDPDEAVKRQARELENAGWTQPTDEEQSFPDGGKSDGDDGDETTGAGAQVRETEAA